MLGRDFQRELHQSLLRGVKAGVCALHPDLEDLGAQIWKIWVYISLAEW